MNRRIILLIIIFAVALSAPFFLALHPYFQRVYQIKKWQPLPNKANIDDIFPQIGSSEVLLIDSNRQLHSFDLDTLADTSFKLYPPPLQRKEILKIGQTDNNIFIISDLEDKQSMSIINKNGLGAPWRDVALRGTITTAKQYDGQTIIAVTSQTSNNTMIPALFGRRIGYSIYKLDLTTGKYSTIASDYPLLISSENYRYFFTEWEDNTYSYIDLQNNKQCTTQYDKRLYGKAIDYKGRLISHGWNSDISVRELSCGGEKLIIGQPKWIPYTSDQARRDLRVSPSKPLVLSDRFIINIETGEKFTYPGYADACQWSGDGEYIVCDKLMVLGKSTARRNVVYLTNEKPLSPAYVFEKTSQYTK